MTSENRTNDFWVMGRINSLISTSGKLPPVNWAYVHNALIKSMLTPAEMAFISF